MSYLSEKEWWRERGGIWKEDKCQKSWCLYYNNDLTYFGYCSCYIGKVENVSAFEIVGDACKGIKKEAK